MATLTKSFDHTSITPNRGGLGAVSPSLSTLSLSIALFCLILCRDARVSENGKNGNSTEICLAILELHVSREIRSFLTIESSKARSQNDIRYCGKTGKAFVLNDTSGIRAPLLPPPTMGHTRLRSVVPCLLFSDIPPSQPS